MFSGFTGYRMSRKIEGQDQMQEAPKVWLHAFARRGPGERYPAMCGLVLLPLVPSRHLALSSSASISVSTARSGGCASPTAATQTSGRVASGWCARAGAKAPSARPAARSAAGRGVRVIRKGHAMPRQTSSGTCSLCQGTFSTGTMTRHLRACQQRQAALQAPAPARRFPAHPVNILHLVAEGGGPYWLHL